MNDKPANDEVAIALSCPPEIDPDCSLDEQNGEELSAKANWADILSVVSVIACVIAVLMDPLFFFIPFIDEENMCVGTDEAVRITALTSRALTDFTFLVQIIYQIRGAVVESKKSTVQIDGNSKSFGWLQWTKAMATELSCRSFITDIFAVLPVPQVLIAYLFYQFEHGYGFSSLKMIMNFILLIQYFPRMYRVFLSTKTLRKNDALWFKGIFYFFMYILTSYVLGAFWYFNSIQRRTSCWLLATIELCRSSVSIMLEQCQDELYSFRCKSFPTNLSVVNVRRERCPVDPRNDTVFNFGVFGDVLGSGNMGNDGFGKKLFYFMWWGLKNLSNFGTNLNTSGYVWENCFAILICATGLILFAYLIGNMQECMRSAEEKKMVRDKVQRKLRELQAWMNANRLPEKLEDDKDADQRKQRDIQERMNANCFPERLRKEIVSNIEQKLEDNPYADLENLFSLLPWNSVKSLKPFFCMNMLKKVPRLQNLDEKWLRMICHFLKPVIYSEKTILFGVGEPLDSMLFIVEGIVLIYSTSRSSDSICQAAGKAITVGSPAMIHRSLENGDVYGDEQLLSWAFSTDISYAALPISTETVRCNTKVEGFALIAKDLKSVVSSYKLHISNSDTKVECSTYGSGGTSMIHRIPRPGTVGGANSEESGI